MDDVRQVIEAANLRDVVLVGHSYSGMVVTGAADYAGPATAQAALDPAAGDWRVANFFPIAKFGPFANRDAKMSFSEKLIEHPIATLFNKIRLDKLPVERRTFVRSTLDPMALFDAFAEHAKTSPDWSYHEIGTGHDAMLTAPETLAGILQAAAASRRRA